jgi:hypothetical protein
MLVVVQHLLDSNFGQNAGYGATGASNSNFFGKMLVIATGAKFSNFLGRQLVIAQQPQITQIFR